MTRRDAQTHQEFSRVLWGTFVWRVRAEIEYGFEKGSAPDDLYSPESLDELCLDFHEPLPIPEGIRKHRRVGSLWVIARYAGVRLEQRGKILVASMDSSSQLRDRFAQLVGKRLLEVVVQPPGGDTAFVFEDDLVLSCFPARSQEGISWLIETEEGDVLKLGPGARLTYESGLR